MSVLAFILNDALKSKWATLQEPNAGQCCVLSDHQVYLQAEKEMLLKKLGYNIAHMETRAAAITEPVTKHLQGHHRRQLQPNETQYEDKCGGTWQIKVGSILICFFKNHLKLPSGSPHVLSSKHYLLGRGTHVAVLSDGELAPRLHWQNH